MNDRNVERDEWVSAYLLGIGEEREALHADHKSSRPLSEGYELVGLAGEFAFGRAVGLMPDFEKRPGGDNGRDFVVDVAYSVDVKCARLAGNLIHEEGKPFCDIYVLAEFDDATAIATLVGWEWGAVLRAAPVKDFGYGVRNHYIERARLRPISDLTRRVRLGRHGKN